MSRCFLIWQAKELENEYSMDGNACLLYTSELFALARQYALEKGFSFMQVKTVQMGCYDIYDDTNKFYKSLGFKEFEVFPPLWDEWNPCQIYVMYLG